MELQILEDVKYSLNGINITSVKRGDKFTTSKKQEIAKLILLGAILDPSLDKKDAQAKREELLKIRSEKIEKFQTAQKMSAKGSLNPAIEKENRDLKAKLEEFEKNEADFKEEKEILAEDQKAFEEDKEAYDNGEFIKASEALLNQQSLLDDEREEFEKEKADFKVLEEALKKDLAELTKAQKALEKTSKKK